MWNRLLLSAIALAYVACRAVQPSAGAPGPALQADSCLLAGTGELPRNLVVAVTEPFTPGRPESPATRAEWFLVRHLYETLVRVSCDGRLLPGLAESWSLADSGRIWIFTLRGSAKFWDGTPLLPSHVLNAWAGHPTSDATVPWAGIEHARAIDGRRIAVSFARPLAAPAVALADPRLSITMASRRPWPDGTGPYRPGYEDSTIAVIDWWDSGIPGSAALPRNIEIHAVTGAGARDLVDRGVDFLVTDDRAVLDYAAARGEYQVHPLPWDRAYRLFVPAPPLAPQPVEVPQAAFIESLAGDAVEAEARVADSSGVWLEESCGTGPAGAVDFTGRPRRVVYPDDDETARAIAHRLVTFAGVPGQGGEWLAAAFRNPPAARSFPFAIGLEPPAWLGALQRGDEVALVYSAPARPYGACSLPPHVDGWAMPLVVTRARLAAHAGSGAMRVDWNGTPIVTGVR